MIKFDNYSVFSTEGKLINKKGLNGEPMSAFICTPEHFNADDYYEVDVYEKPAYTKAEYDEMVAQLVRERYTESEEFAIQRKAINAMLNPETVILSETEDRAQIPVAIIEYNAYNEYVEECKRRAPAEMKRRGEGRQIYN